MSHVKHSPLQKQIRNIKRSFLQLSELSLSETLSGVWLRTFANAVATRSNTIYTPLVTLRIFLQQVLSDDASCNAAVARFLIEHSLKADEKLSANSGPYCAARQRLPLDLLQSGVRETGESIQEAGKRWSWRGFNVMMVDGTTALMPDTEDNQKHFPQQSTQKPGLGFPIVRIGALISYATGAILDYAIAPYEGKGTGETSLLARMLSALGVSDLLLADRYYATYGVLAILIRSGVAAVMPNHANRRVDYRKGKRLGKRDCLITWDKPPRKPVWMSESEYAEIPEKITVRHFRSGGRDYVTTLTDAKRYSKKELAKLYANRWSIEVDFRSIKTHMQMEMLRCQTAEMAKKEIAVNFMAYNLIRNAIAQSAIMQDKLPRNISFRGTVQLILANAMSII